MKICPRLLIFELSGCTLRIFRGYDFSIFLVLLFLDRYFGGFDSDLPASTRMFSYGVPPWVSHRKPYYEEIADFCACQVIIYVGHVLKMEFWKSTLFG